MSDHSDDHYVDDWGYARKRPNLADWSEFEPWQYWETQFDWKKETKLIEQDMIAFRDNVTAHLPDGATLHRKAARFVIARIANLENNTVYMEVIHSEGYGLLQKEELIKRDMAEMLKYGVYRWPRCGRSPRRNVTPEQRARGDKLKEKRKERANSSRFYSAGRGSGGACSCAFARASKRGRQSKTRRPQVRRPQIRPDGIHR